MSETEETPDAMPQEMRLVCEATTAKRRGEVRTLRVDGKPVAAIKLHPMNYVSQLRQFLPRNRHIRAAIATASSSNAKWLAFSK